jgi:hypothetical protein
MLLRIILVGAVAVTRFGFGFNQRREILAVHLRIEDTASCNIV